MHTARLDYRDDNVVCEAFVAYDETTDRPRPCVLIGHSWAGQIDADRETATKMARLGYVGFALDATPQNLLDFAKEMSAAGADWQVHAYGNTMHAFTAPGANMPDRGVLYNADAARRSWITIENFFEEVFA